MQQTQEGVNVRTGNSSDKRQYERWIEILGKERMPDSLDKFREIKYNEPEKFKELQAVRESIRFQNNVQSGGTPISIHAGKQDKHRIGTNNYIAGRSYIDASNNVIQKVVNKYAGHGIMRITDKKNVSNKEYIYAMELTGFVIDQFCNTVETHGFYIHYTERDGVHLVPTLWRPL